ISHGNAGRAVSRTTAQPQSVAQRPQQVLMCIESSGMITGFYPRADQQSGHATAGPAGVERTQIAFIPRHQEQAVLLEIRVGKQLWNMALKPLIGLGQGAIMSIVAGVRDNVGEIGQAAVSDVLRK